jgi:GNAT superfamily N-acetyltransferase
MCRASQWATLARLMALCFQGLPPEQLSYQVRTHGPSSRIFTERGTPVGYWMHKVKRPGTAWLEQIAVDPAMQGRGIGALLLQDYLEFAESLGFEQVALSVLRSNANAVALYRRWGFVEGADRTEDRILFTKTLDGSPSVPSSSSGSVRAREDLRRPHEPSRLQVWWSLLLYLVLVTVPQRGAGVTAGLLGFLNHLRRRCRRTLELGDRIVVPVANVVLGLYARLCPGRHRASVDAAIERGIRFFEGQERLAFDAAATFSLIVNASFDARLAVVQEKIRRYAREWNDPHLRLLDERYDPDRPAAGARAVDVGALYDVEKPIVRCLYADRLAGDDLERLLHELDMLDDAGHYGTTHKLLGCLTLKKFSTIPLARLDRMIAATIPSIVRAQRSARACDIFSERTTLLQWLGHDDVVRRAWIVRIVRAQMANGGWYWRRARLATAEQHPSCVALAALLLYREAGRRRAGRSRARSAEIGRAIALVDGAF